MMIRSFKSYSDELRIHPYDINRCNGIKITAPLCICHHLTVAWDFENESNSFFDMLVHVIKKLGCLNICKAIKIDPCSFFSFSTSLVFLNFLHPFVSLSNSLVYGNKCYVCLRMIWCCIYKIIKILMMATHCLCDRIILEKYFLII